MLTIAALEVLLCWLLWWYPPLFLAPHWQKRPSVAVTAPSLIGLVLQIAAFAVALFWRWPHSMPPATWRLIAAMIPGPLGSLLEWSAVRHLGRQFRIRAGLYEDHQLVRTGPYAIVRHPIYAAVLLMLVATALVTASWPGVALSLALLVAGTEIRVRAEDRLLAGRFPTEFAAYKNSVPAYVPFVR
jgi:protein-S-isoprenylcysteine O-methyltransferase Ste14